MWKGPVRILDVTGSQIQQGSARVLCSARYGNFSPKAAQKPGGEGWGTHQGSVTLTSLSVHTLLHHSPVLGWEPRAYLGWDRSDKRSPCEQTGLSAARAEEH